MDDYRNPAGREANVNELRRARHERELGLLNAHASRLNAAAEQALADQVDLEDG